VQRLRHLRWRAATSSSTTPSRSACAETDDESVLDASGACPMGAIAVFELANGDQPA
jgi:hypothetical protein